MPRIHPPEKLASRDWLRSIRNKHYEETKGMSIDERMEYIRNKCEAFRSRVEKTENTESEQIIDKNTM
ncbi:MAG: hypothetical protein ACRC2T_08365 [Thermoguttaceae bacterium]